MEGHRDGGVIKKRGSRGEEKAPLHRKQVVGSDR